MNARLESADTVVLTIGCERTRPQGRRVVLPANGSPVTALTAFLAQNREGVDPWLVFGGFRNDYRKKDNFEFTSFRGIDIDYFDLGGDHVDAPEDRAAALVQLAQKGLLGGHLGHLTKRRGLRLIDGYNDTIRCPEDFGRLAEKRIKEIAIVLVDHGLAAALADGEPRDGFSIDVPATKDSARFFWTPCGQIDGRPRAAQVFVISEDLYDLKAVLDAVAPKDAVANKPVAGMGQSITAGGARERRYCEQALADACTEIQRATSGNRNTTLYGQARGIAGLVSGGFIDGSSAQAELRSAAFACPAISDDARFLKHELEISLANGWRDGLAHPRALPPPKEAGGNAPPASSSCQEPTPARWLATSADPMRLAELFAKKVCIDSAGRWTWAPWCGTWWRWDGVRYGHVDDDGVRRALWRFLDLVDIEKHGKKGGSYIQPIELNNALVANVLAAVTALAEPIVGEAPQWRDGSLSDLTSVVACQNGILNMVTKTLSPSTPSLFITTSAKTNWIPGSPPPTAWLKFLKEIFAGNSEVIAALQMIMGYLISGETGQQKMFALIGPKRSGKSTIERVIKALLETAVTSPTMSGLAERFGLAPLIGKSVAIISDCRLSGRMDHTAAVERLLTITGEGSISIDRKNKDIVDVRLRTRFLLISNEVPGLRDSSGAMASRFIVLATKRSFLGEEDLGLEARLLNELAGIFRWAVDGWGELKAKGRFIQPRASFELITELEALGSPVAVFVTERCEVDPGGSIAIADMYTAYRSWCETTGRIALDDAGFGAALRSAVPSVTKVRPGSASVRQRRYQGVRLAPP